MKKVIFAVIVLAVAVHVHTLQAQVYSPQYWKVTPARTLAPLSTTTYPSITLGVSGCDSLDTSPTGTIVCGTDASGGGGGGTTTTINSVSGPDFTFSINPTTTDYALTTSTGNVFWNLLPSSTWAKLANNLSDLPSTSSARANLGFSAGNKISISATGTISLTTSSNSQFFNDSLYITDGNQGWVNEYGLITDGNSGWDNSYGFITATSTEFVPSSTTAFARSSQACGGTDKVASISATGTIVCATDQDGGSGAPTDAPYLTATSSASLSNEKTCSTVGDILVYNGSTTEMECFSTTSNYESLIGNPFASSGVSMQPIYLAVNWSATSTEMVTNSATSTNILPLFMSVRPSSTFSGECAIPYKTAATGTGISLGIFSNLSTRIVAAHVRIPQGAAGLDHLFENSLTAFNVFTSSTATLAANTYYIAQIMFSGETSGTSSASGVIAPIFHSEVAGSNVTVDRSSWCWLAQKQITGT